MLEVRFLIVDSSKSLKAYLLQLFEDFSFDARLIKSAEEPETALVVAKKLKPDFLLTDWFAQAPMNGLALYQEVLKLNPLCQLGLFSTEMGPAQIDESTAAGAVFLLPKPCTSEQIRAALGKGLQQLVLKNPRIDDPAYDDADIAARHLSTLKLASTLAPLRPGESVSYKGRPDSVRHALFSRGQAWVQLEGERDLVPASDVRRA
ncbi:response regulator [Rhodoferax aquaticus]|nr:response regulator [Rhodoferax aquaticus]